MTPHPSRLSRWRTDQRAPMRYVAGDGTPKSLSEFRSLGVCWTRPFRSLTVPLLGSVPSRCRCFTLLALFAQFLWLSVVSCGICSTPLFTRYLSEIVKRSLFVLRNFQHLPTYGTSIAFPFGRLTCALGVAN